MRYLVGATLAFAPGSSQTSCSLTPSATRPADMAFASNLLGAMLGGAMEYLALVTGFRSLLLVVLVLYGLAFLLASRWRRLADRESRR